jgi:hypothetical protein
MIDLLLVRERQLQPTSTGIPSNIEIFKKSVRLHIYDQQITRVSPTIHIIIWNCPMLVLIAIRSEIWSFPAAAGVYTCMVNTIPIGGSPLPGALLRRRNTAECSMACSMTATCRSFSLRTVVVPNAWQVVECQMNTGSYLTTNGTGSWTMSCAVQPWFLQHWTDFQVYLGRSAQPVCKHAPGWPLAGCKILCSTLFGRSRVTVTGYSATSTIIIHVLWFFREPVRLFEKKKRFLCCMAFF